MSAYDNKVNFDNKVIGFDTDYSPSLSDTPLRSADSGPEKYIIVFTSNKNSDDLALSILPDTEYFNNIVKEHDLTVVARGVSDISISSLSYGLQHSTRLLYKSLVQDLNYFYSNNIMNRFENDDKLLREELNKLI
jgi:hypothetical protein